MKKNKPDTNTVNSKELSQNYKRKRNRKKLINKDVVFFNTIGKFISVIILGLILLMTAGTVISIVMNDWIGTTFFAITAIVMIILARFFYKEWKEED